LRNHIENVGKHALEQNGKDRVNENDEEIFRGKERSSDSLRDGAAVPSSWPGLSRPSTSSLSRALKDVDARTSPGVTPS
jgi:hypothetical protein